MGAGLTKGPRFARAGAAPAAGAVRCGLCSLERLRQPLLRGRQPAKAARPAGGLTARPPAHTGPQDEDGASVIDRLFGIPTAAKLVCEESGEEVSEAATSYTLKCNIAGDTNYLHQVGGHMMWP